MSAASAAPDLSRLFSPRGIAVVGATDSRTGVGGQPMHYLTGYGYAGEVFPVNPRREDVLGRTCYPSLSDVPGPCDVVLIAVPSRSVPGIVREAGACGIPFAVVLSAGFREAGEEGRQIEAELVSAGRDAGVRIVGPNCMGVLNIPEKVHNGFGQGFGVRDYPAGPVAMATQSGGYGFTMVRNASRGGLGFNYVASVGNSVDLNVLDFVDYFLDRDDVKVVTAFIEGISDGRRLLALGRKALEVGKPILVWKAGRTGAGAKAAASHTASLAASYALYRAAFREGGYIELNDYEDLVDVARAFLGGVLPRGNRVALVSGSGGAGVVASDRFVEAGLQLPDYTEATHARLRDILPPLAVPANPVDLSGQNTKDGRSLSNAAVEVVLGDDDIDMVMVRSGQSIASPERAGELIGIARASGKPVLVATVAEDHLSGKATLDEAGVPWFLTVGRAAVAARALADFAARRRRIEASGDAAQVPPWSRRELALPAGGGKFLSERASREVLAAYDIPTTRQRAVPLDGIDALDALDLAFPVAVKVNSADLPHKSEAGGIRLGLADLDAVKAAAHEVVAKARAHAPKAEIDAVLIQEMARGAELMLGAVDDECFGPVVLFGLGGIFAELIGDVAYRFAPLDHAAAREMIGEIRGALILEGYRGQPAVDPDALADIIVRLGQLITDHRGRIESIDVNPLFVLGGDIAAADALVVLRGEGG